MPGLTYSNELISRDEALHCRFSIMVYKSLNNRLDVKSLHALIGHVVDIEKAFVRDALRCPLIGMNATDMIQYVEFVADLMCDLFDVPPLFNAQNPFDFMEVISLQGKTNFFEKRVSEYQKVSDRRIANDAFKSGGDF